VDILHIPFRRRIECGRRNGAGDLMEDRFSSLRCREVINICDGRRLGCVCDLEMDAISGKICTLIIPECGSKWNFFGKERAFFVPWRCIRRIGDDIILVEVDGEEILRTDGD
jgi:YlmC/YmxH family sporulation protein